MVPIDMSFYYNNLYYAIQAKHVHEIYIIIIHIILIIHFFTALPVPSQFDSSHIITVSNQFWSVVMLSFDQLSIRLDFSNKNVDYCKRITLNIFLEKSL